MSARAFPFPVLSESSICYVDRVSYEAKISRPLTGGDIVVRHQLSGKNLVASLIENKRAKFACVVAVPMTMHRKVYSMNDRENYSEENEGQIFAMQNIPCDEEELSKAPKLRPIIVCTESVGPKLVMESYGLDPFYDREHIHFPDGAIIADADWKDFKGHGSILRIRNDDGREFGTFDVTISETEGFYFVVSVGPKLFQFLQHPGERGDRCMDILTHAFTSGLAKLHANKTLCKTWRNYQTLQVLHQDLTARGIKTWEEEDFSPELAATTIHPHDVDFEGEQDNAY